MTAPEAFDETESYGNYEDFEFASEAAVRDHRRAAPRIFVPGGVSSATLNTPKGPAKLNLPSAVATLQQYRALEQTVNATNARLSAATADLARVRQELALRRRDSNGQGGGMMSLMFPLLMQKQLREDLEGHTHVGSTAPAVIAGGSGSSFSTFLPLMLMQPNMFGQSGSGSQASGAQDGMSQMMMMFVMMELFRDRGA
jgi:outer membrane murein-binding lipoprotein Lpp